VVERVADDGDAGSPGVVRTRRNSRRYPGSGFLRGRRRGCAVGGGWLPRKEKTVVVEPFSVAEGYLMADRIEVRGADSEHEGDVAVESFVM
jgi:hypothetical protein